MCGTYFQMLNYDSEIIMNYDSERGHTTELLFWPLGCLGLNSGSKNSSGTIGKKTNLFVSPFLHL